MRVYNVYGNEPIPPETVYCGRGSIWGNPFKIGVDGNRSVVILKYYYYLWTSPQLTAKLEELHGKDLSCFCYPLACHCDILISAVDSLYG